MTRRFRSARGRGQLAEYFIVNIIAYIVACLLGWLVGSLIR